MAELEHCQNVGKLKDEKVAELQERVNQLRDLVDIEKSRIAELKEANAARGEASKVEDKREGNNERLLKSYESSISRIEAELTRVRAERDSLRRSRFKWGAVAMLVGGVLGFFLRGNN